MKLVSGSRGGAGASGDARTFYQGIDVYPVEFGARARAGDGRDLEGGSVAPMHPSYEDRAGAPDRVFASLDDLEFERHVRAWGTALEHAGLRAADLLHLHHLTPINEAAARLAPDLPVVGQLHGTELLMLEQIATGPPPGWRHAERWRDRMIEWAERSRCLLVAPGGIDRASDLLALDRGRMVPLPSGFDPATFRPRRVDRRAHWRRHLVSEPQGSSPGGRRAISYPESEVAVLDSAVVLMYVGRFTEVKRLPLLIDAFARAQSRFRRSAALVLVGGYPGEWEGEHPADSIARAGAGDVFLAGWHDQSVLPAFLAAADAFVFPSVREQFGQALVEAMACGLPAVAADSFGARTILDDGETGWLVPGDDPEALAEALVEVVDDEAERERRGRRARQEAARYSWPLVAGRAAEVFARETRSPQEPGSPVRQPAGA